MKLEMPSITSKYSWGRFHWKGGSIREKTVLGSKQNTVLGSKQYV